MRKAFLDNDLNHDGFLTIEEFLDLFFRENELVTYEDMKTLFDHRASMPGRMSYTDFCQWVGSSIHQSEGFYFRHDSCRNPQQMEYVEAKEKRTLQSGFTEGLKHYLPQGELEQLIWTKIGQQWKSIREAYRDIQGQGHDGITAPKLRRQFSNWGVQMTEEQFLPIFKKIDLDADGTISYTDFLSTVGRKCFPREGLFFRQDISVKEKSKQVVLCVMYGCSARPTEDKKYCGLHQKLLSEQASQNLTDLASFVDPVEIREKLGRSLIGSVCDFDAFVKAMKNTPNQLTED